MKLRLTWVVSMVLPLMLTTTVACSPPPKVPVPPSDVDDEDELPPPIPEVDLANSCGLIIASTPSTEVLVNGKKVGKTPLEVDNLPAGTHEVTFLGPDGDNVTMTVELAEGQYQRVHHNVVPRAREM